MSLDVGEGECIAIMGTNGSGKTTLFEIISRNQEPDAGDLRYLGEDLRRFRPHDLASRGLLRLFQTPLLCQALTVAEHLLLSREARPVPGQLATEALAGFGLDAIALRSASGLTLFQKRSVELARAYLTCPRLLLLDELTSGLDSFEREHALRLLERIRDLGTAIVLIEHDPWILERLTTRLVVLDQGAVVAEGSTRSVLASDNVRRLSIGTRHVAAD
ncbi:MAG: ATP-binding cassette domain-containing protein [Thermoanaerobaculia bacterium]